MMLLGTTCAAVVGRETLPGIWHSDLAFCPAKKHAECSKILPGLQPAPCSCASVRAYGCYALAPGLSLLPLLASGHPPAVHQLHLIMVNDCQTPLK